MLFKSESSSPFTAIKEWTKLGAQSVKQTIHKAAQRGIKLLLITKTSECYRWNTSFKGSRLRKSDFQFFHSGRCRLLFIKIQTWKFVTCGWRKVTGSLFNSCLSFNIRFIEKIDWKLNDLSELLKKCWATEHCLHSIRWAFSRSPGPWMRSTHLTSFFYIRILSRITILERVSDHEGYSPA